MREEQEYSVTMSFSDDDQADYFDYWGDYYFDTEEEAEKFANKVKNEADSFFGNEPDIIEGDKNFHLSIDTHDYWSDEFYISDSGHVTPRDIW